MTDPKTQKQEQTDNKIPANPEEKPKTQDELTIEELASISTVLESN